MALDESHDDDEVFKDREITYVVNKKLFDEVKPINIDYLSTSRGAGFKLTSALDGAAGCGTSCSTC